MRKDKTERNKKIIVYFIAFIMIGSVFGVIFFGFAQQTNKVKYNGFVFVQKNNLWATKVNGKEVFFSYLPKDVNIDLGNDIVSRLTALVEIDTTSEFNNSFKEYIALAEHHLSFNLNKFNIYVRTGFTTENEFNKVVINCGDATLNVPVVYFKEGNETKIYLQNDCIIAEGKENFDFLRIKDILVYNILGILK